jgi:serine/threonine-protein kinase RsbW
VSDERLLTITNQSKNLSEVRQVVAEMLDPSGFDRRQTNEIILAVDEGLANVVEHAYQGGVGEVKLIFGLDEENFRVHIRDNGVRFEPNVLRDAVDIHAHIKKGLKGGLGLFLMKRIMDDVYYTHDGPDYVNELVMVKKVPAVGEADN